MIDVLSGSISHLDLQTAPSTRLEASRNWSLSFAISTTLKFATVLRGQVWLTVKGQGPMKLGEGDAFFLTNGAQYVIGSNPNLPPKDGLAMFDWASGGTARLDGDETIMAGGAINVPDGAALPIFSSMSKFIPVRASDPAAGPLHASMALLASEMTNAEVGAAAAARRLSEIVVIYALRAMTAHDAGNSGVMNALADPYVSRALQMMNQDAARRWTVAELARAVGLSRSAFADRFVRRLGSPPLAYLTQRRLDQARAALVDGAEPVAEVAYSAGYGSESAFGLAFKKRFGISPARYRAQHRYDLDGSAKHHLPEGDKG